MVFPHVIDVQPGRTDCGNGCDCVDEMRTFSHRIDNNHNTVFSICFWQFRYKIDTDHIPRAVWNRMRVEFAHWWLTRGFCTETHVTGGDVLSNIAGHLRPPIVSRHQL